LLLQIKEENKRIIRYFFPAIKSKQGFYADGKVENIRQNQHKGKHLKTLQVTMALIADGSASF